MNKPKIIFVYNAGSSVFAQVTDYAHKVLKPSTYQCNLCKLTHTNFGMKAKWRTFLKALSLDMQFLHKDEFTKEFPAVSKETELPAILLNSDGTIETILSAKELQNISELSELQTKLLTTLKERGFA